MKIAFFSPSFYPATIYGGPIFSCLNLCRELHRNGVDLDIHSTNANQNSRLDVPLKRKVKLEELDGGEVCYHNENLINRLSLSMIFTMFKTAYTNDLIHTQSIFSICTPVSILLGFIYRKPVVISPRGSLGEWCLSQGSGFKKTWLKLFFKPFLKNIYWHVTADFEKNDVLRVFGMLNNDKFINLPNGINKEQHIFSRAELESNLKLEKDDDYILSVGRIDDKKGLDYTIRSLVYTSGIKLVIAGVDYGAKEYLVNLAKDLKVSDRVIFVGHVDGDLKWSLYKYAKVFVLNSRHENFGNVYLEALSVGTPIIASINTPWSFINNTNAGVCIENEPDLIAESIIRITTSDLYTSEACKKVAADFYWSEIAKRFEAEYARILNVY